MKKRWSSYEPIKRLGHGAYGMVYLAEGKPAQHERDPWRYPGKCAIKCILARDLGEKELKAAANEVSILSSMNHPGCVEYYEYFLDDEGYMNIVQEVAAGGDLLHFIDDHKKANQQIDPSLIMDFSFQLLSTLEYLESQKTIHRDLKPANVFLTGNGNIKIGDFGISKVVNTVSMKARTFVGTPHYIAPELMSGDAYSFVADMWALGCIIFELLALETAFQGGNFMALVLKISEGKHGGIPPHTPKILEEIISKLLTVDQNQRPNAKAVLEIYFRPQALISEEAEARIMLRDIEVKGRRTLDIVHEELERMVLSANPASRLPLNEVRSLSVKPACQPTISASDLAYIRELKIKEKMREAADKRRTALKKQKDQEAAKLAARKEEEDKDQLLVQAEKNKPIEVQKNDYFRLLAQRGKEEKAHKRRVEFMISDDPVDDREPDDFDPLVTGMMNALMKTASGSRLQETVKQIASDLLEREEAEESEEEESEEDSDDDSDSKDESIEEELGGSRYGSIILNDVEVEEILDAPDWTPSPHAPSTSRRGSKAMNKGKEEKAEVEEIMDVTELHMPTPTPPRRKKKVAKEPAEVVLEVPKELVPTRVEKKVTRVAKVNKVNLQL